MAIWKSIYQQCFYIKYNPWISYRSFIFRQYHAVTSKTNSYCQKGTFLKSRERRDRLTKKCFSDKPERTVSVIVSRGPLQWISNKIKLFLVNSYFDADFDEKTFLEGAKQVATTLSGCYSISVNILYSVAQGIAS